MTDIVITIYSQFNNYSVICCTDALLSDDEKCPKFHDGYNLQCTFISGMHVSIHALILQQLQ